jgi:hypothetical protein
MNAINTKSTFLGRCKRCKTPRRIDAPEVSRERRQLGYGRTEVKVFRALPSGRKIEGAAHFFVPCETCAAAGVERHVCMTRLQGSKSEHVCGAKCRNSTGFVCECSCGGANHGVSVTLELA